MIKELTEKKKEKATKGIKTFKTSDKNKQKIKVLLNCQNFPQQTLLELLCCGEP